MPERNLVTKFVSSFMVLVIGLAFVTVQVGCSKLRQSSLDNDFITLDNTPPSWNDQPTEPASDSKPGRFVNDPQKALKELNEAAGELGANQAVELGDGLDELVAQEADARIFGVSDTIDTDSKTVKLTATPPAPAITNSSGVFSDPIEPYDRSSFSRSDLRPTPIGSDLLGNKKMAIKDPNCDHQDCDCLKPKLKPVLPFAKPIEPPVVATLAPPSQLVSQPLSPILFDEETRRIELPTESEMRNNALRSAKTTLEKPTSQIARQEFDGMPAPDGIVVESVTPNSQVAWNSQTTGFVNPSKTKIHANENSATNFDLTCSECDSVGCNGKCESTNRMISTLQPIVASEEIAPQKVVIVATMSKDTVPPFAEPPEIDVVESIPELVRVESKAIAPSLTEVAGNFAPIEIEDSIEFRPTIERAHWDDSPAQPAEGEFVPPANFEPPMIPSALVTDFANPIAAPQLAEQADFQVVEESQATPIEVADAKVVVENEFQSNGFIPSSQNFGDNDQSQWVAPTANFSPVEAQPVETPPLPTLILPSPAVSQPVKFPVETLVEPVAEKAQYKAPDSNAGLDEGLFPVVDTTIEPFPIVETLDPPVETPIEPEWEMPEPEVIVEVIDNTVPWSEKLVETIETVKAQLTQEKEPMARNGLEVNLRLLEVLQRQMVSVEESQNALSNVERQYWQHQLDAINLMLPSKADDSTDFERHNTAHETLDHLRKAVERLERIANLKVSNGTFCTEISGFGKFKPFTSTTFRAGQKTLVYCEVENFLSQIRTENFQSSFRTKLRGSYVIYDQQGRAVQQAEYPTVEDVSRKRRRDFYLYFPIQIGKLAPGNYKLELLVEDLGGNKTASLNPGMDFQVR